ncbi:porin, partial [Polaromonas hydrogenivorans]
LEKFSMKKTLIALAALGAMAGVAHAQSTVTLYGVADAYVGQVTTKTQVGAAAETRLSQNVVNGSGLSSSRWGLRGAEDLGGGLSAVFTLEGAFDISTGAVATIAPQGNTLFGRQAFVGLKGGFGTVSLGRHTTAYDTLRGITNNIYNSPTFATTASVWGVGVQDYQVRASNSVAYTSPDFAGISGAVVYGLGENKTATTDAENSASLHIKYANGPLLVGYAHQREKQVAGGNFFGTSTGVPAPVTTVTDTRKYNSLGASYNFGVANLTGGYNTAKSNTRKDKEYQLGVSVPFGAAALAAGYSRAKSEGAAGLAALKGTGFTLLGTYNLSKRTTAYAAVINTKRESGTTAAFTTTKVLTSAVGIRHTF